MNHKQRKILVTAALPYANGPIHLGHLVEYIQTDIWVRFQKLRGHRCVFMWADDTHGTAIMIRARNEGRSEEAVIADAAEEHLRDFAGFQIGYDHYGSTHSDENRELVRTKSGKPFATAAWSRKKTSSNCTMPSRGRFWPIGLSVAPAPTAKRRINRVTTAANAARPIRQPI